MRLFLLIVLLAAAVVSAQAQPDEEFFTCSLCGAKTKVALPIRDKITGETNLFCPTCYALPRCWVCDCPVRETDFQLPDGRKYCARDSQGLVLNVGEAGTNFSQVASDLDRLFSRFISFPSNVEVLVYDKLAADMVLSGANESPNSFARSDLLGAIHSDEASAPDYEQFIKQVSLRSGKPLNYYGIFIRNSISLLTGQPLAQFKATCAHELGHAWVCENVPAQRKKTSRNPLFPEYERSSILGADAEEGFCELVAYKYMDSLHDERQKKRILENLYTHGQTALLVEADRRFGFNEIVDWMQYGVAAQLDSNQLVRIREVKMPAPQPVNYTLPVASIKPDLPDTIKLQGIIWGAHPTALINGRSFSSNDQFTIKIGSSNVLIRCLEIQKTGVRIRYVDSGQDERLSN